MSDTIILRDESLGDDNFHVSYVFNSPNTNPTVPTPTQIQERTTPYLKAQRQPAGIGLFAQDKWTLNRLTVNAGVRFDYLDVYAPAIHLGPALLVPTRNIDLPETPLVNWKDITPRLGGAYDLFGNGKTAVRVSLNKYVIAQGVQGPYSDAITPVNRLANVVTRSVDRCEPQPRARCDLASRPTASAAGVGHQRTRRRARRSNLLNGWGVRPSNWGSRRGFSTRCCRVSR